MDDYRKENIAMLIKFNLVQFISVAKYRVHTRYVILTCSATVLAGRDDARGWLDTPEARDEEEG
jgi:hypothetical protein